ncbi:ADP-glyceromanno-heptose 6-epimerase [Pseudomonadota bacterium]
MIVVTGGCGFIGSNLVHGLNRHGVDDILVVDDLTQGDKFVNILDCSITDYRDYRAFVSDLPKTGAGDIEAVFHLGACSDTMESDGQYMMRVNYEYSRHLLDFCAAAGIPFIYASSASVYGAGPRFSESPENESALNVYAYSKLLFDRYLRKHRASITSQVVGLRYFNVYGPREQHKGRMASVAYHFYNQFRENGNINLFEGSGGYGDGEQERDFLWVGDAVDVNLYFLDNRDKNGIYNLGTGNARSFNDMARAVVSAVNGRTSDLAGLIKCGTIRYIPFPGALAGKYQSYTQADMSALRQAGYDKPFTPVEQGVAQYVEWRSRS